MVGVNKVPKLLRLYQKCYPVNSLGCSVLKYRPNIFLIKTLGQVCKFVLMCKKIIGLATGFTWTDMWADIHKYGVKWGPLKWDQK